MKKNSSVKFAFLSAFLLFVTFAALPSPPALAAAPDAGIEGLWLTCPGFPAGAEAVSFHNNKEMDIVIYVRGLDGGTLTFEISRQRIEDSNLREPGDVKGVIGVRVGVANDGLDEKAAKSNMESINVAENAEAAKLYSYPCATAEYTTGANEDTRRNMDLFIFTDVYSFEVHVSMAADFAGDYSERLQEWFTGLEFVENGSGEDEGRGDLIPTDED